ncbi:unnamed protein product [Mesocestoides corti]|uniref:Uncharacterized protein n=1 Tax=Mesocestoides corti TaxID=53468 RepID=A0A0R3UPF2_MESCO|nr:unnamed protein product [Mesocestoides corti]
MTAAIRAITGGSTRQLDHLSTIQLVVFAAVVLTFVAAPATSCSCFLAPALHAHAPPNLRCQVVLPPSSLVPVSVASPCLGSILSLSRFQLMGRCAG